MPFSLLVGRVFSFILILPCLTLSYNAGAMNNAHGRLDMQGSIIDAACAIDMRSQYQDIEFKMTSIGMMSRDIESPEIPFGIDLVNCSLTPEHENRPDWSTFRVTFDGQREGADAFKLQGAAKGIGLKIFERDGTAVIPGTPLPGHGLHAGKMHLDYIFRLIGNHDLLVAGDYRTTLRFKLDYF